jgi:hypothetical protein
MSNFSQEEVDQLVKGGNGVARKRWLAAWTPEDCMIPEAGDEKKIKSFIRSCFVRGQWKELPPTEPLENLVGKDAVQQLRFGKNQTNQSTTSVYSPPPSIIEKPPASTHTLSPGPINQPQSEWDPFGSSNIGSAPVSTLSASTSQPVPVPTNPFSSFTSKPTQTPQSQPEPQQNHSKAPITNPSKSVDVHTLFRSTPTATQPASQVTVVPGVDANSSYYVHPYIYPQVSYAVNPWVQPITVQPQVQPVVQTGPDAFSGLLAGFGSKPTATPW